MHYRLTSYLHALADIFSLHENVGELFGAQDVPQRGLRKKSRRVMSILNIGHRYGRVADPVVHNGIHWYRHTVFGKNLRIKENE